jgi:hypothetical protein
MITERFEWQVFYCNEVQESETHLLKTIHKFSNTTTLNFNVADFYTLISVFLAVTIQLKYSCNMKKQAGKFLQMRTYNVVQVDKVKNMLKGYFVCLGSVE